MKNSDEQYMARCLELARRGGRDTGTNPMVGCVIVCDGRIIGEGWHRKFGEAHAEVNALRSVRAEDREGLSRATLYVNLEPCSHYGKTPPCCDAVVAAGIRRVVTGMRDPFPKVNGSGVARMREAGIEVTENVLQEACRELNRRFVVYHGRHRPYVVFKWAQTADGFIDGARDVSQPPVWMTGDACKRLVHRWRSEESAIWVGSRTVLRDDPALTNRMMPGGSPLRLVIDREGVIPSGAKLLDGSADTVVFTDGTRPLPADRPGVRYVGVTPGAGTLDDVMRWLYENGVLSVLVEGGTTLLEALAAKGWVDEARIFVAPRMLAELPGGGNGGVRAPLLPPGDRYEHRRIEEVLLEIVRYDR